MSAKKHKDKNRPGEFFHGSVRLGLIAFKMDVNEVDLYRTIHMDCFDKFPFGHIGLAAARDLRNWLDETIEWMEA